MPRTVALSDKKRLAFGYSPGLNISFNFVHILSGYRPRPVLRVGLKDNAGNFRITKIARKLLKYAGFLFCFFHKGSTLGRIFSKNFFMENLLFPCKIHKMCELSDCPCFGCRLMKTTPQYNILIQCQYSEYFSKSQHIFPY